MSCSCSYFWSDLLKGDFHWAQTRQKSKKQLEEHRQMNMLAIRSEISLMLHSQFNPNTHSSFRQAGKTMAWSFNSAAVKECVLLVRNLITWSVLQSNFYSSTHLRRSSLFSLQKVKKKKSPLKLPLVTSGETEATNLDARIWHFVTVEVRMKRKTRQLTGDITCWALVRAQSCRAVIG